MFFFVVVNDLPVPNYSPKQSLTRTYLWPIVGAVVLIVFVLTWVL